MKTYFIILISCFCLFSSCSTNDKITQEETPAQKEIYQWHLINVSGGLTGLDIDYNLETIIWVFNVDFSNNGSIQVQNNNTDNSLEDGLSSGSFAVSIPIIDNKSYMFIDGTEFGNVSTPSSEDLIIDQNKLSTGTAADRYIYTFKRKIILVDNN